MDAEGLKYEDITSFVEVKAWRPKGTLIKDYPESLIQALIKNIKNISNN